MRSSRHGESVRTRKTRRELRFALLALGVGVVLVAAAIVGVQQYVSGQLHKLSCLAIRHSPSSLNETVRELRDTYDCPPAIPYPAPSTSTSTVTRTVSPTAHALPRRATSTSAAPRPTPLRRSRATPRPAARPTHGVQPVGHAASSPARTVTPPAPRPTRPRPTQPRPTPTPTPTQGVVGRVVCGLLDPLHLCTRSTP